MALEVERAGRDELFGRAAVIGAARPGRYPVSFTSVALAWFAARDPFSRWLQRTAPALGRQIQRAARVSDAVMASAKAGWAPHQPSQVSSSIAAVRAEAQRIAGDVPSAAWESHVIFAVYCFGKVAHDRDFTAWGFDRTEWTRRLLAWVAMHRPRELGDWLRAAGSQATRDLLADVEHLGREASHESDHRDLGDILDLLTIWPNNAFVDAVFGRGLVEDRASPPGEGTGTGRGEGTTSREEGSASATGEAVVYARGEGSTSPGEVSASPGETSERSRAQDSASRPRGFAGFVAARGWHTQIRPRYPVEAALDELALTAEVYRGVELALVMAFPARVPMAAALVAASIAAPPGSLPSAAVWFEARGETASDETWAWLLDTNPSLAPQWLRVRDIWSEVDAPALSGFDNDEARGGADQLGFRRDVAALAQLLAASENRGIKPPLSVGLFGDWGSGKTFFMDMLEAKIDQLKDSGEPAFCQRIVQIRFNAWHYVDADLWASLATHLFDELNAKLPRESEAETQTRIESELETSRAEAERIENERTALDTKRKGLLAEAAREQTERETKQLELHQLSVDAVAHVIKHDPELGEQIRQLRAQWRAVSAFFTARTLAFAVVGVAICAVAFYTLDALTARLASLAAIGATLGARLWGILREAVPHGERVLEAYRTLEQRIRGQPSDRERVLRDDIAASEVHSQELIATGARLHADIVRLEAMQQQIARNHSYAEFIARRSASDDYRKQLGIVSLLQRDFSELNQQLAHSDSEGGRRVQRIVLYVDDLDRCPADKVVQVLQAVHLLLSFPLFVVVVAVDPTWVLRALGEHYAQQMTRTGGDRIPAANPHAYLEKIFQIPIRVRPMAQTSYQRLIDQLTGGQVAATPEPEPGWEGPGDRDIAEGDERSEYDDGDGDGDGEGRESPTPAELAAEAAAAARDREAAIDPELTGAALTLEPRETAYLKTLAGLVPNPRAAKRLVNVYRLIRAQLTPAERTRFVRDGDGTFHAVMLLLALNARFPAAAVELCERIAAETVDPKTAPGWPALRERLEPAETDREWRAMWTAIPESAPISAMRPAQLRSAALLANRYSLPGPPLQRDP